MYINPTDITPLREYLKRIVTLAASDDLSQYGTMIGHTALNCIDLLNHIERKGYSINTGENHD